MWPAVAFILPPLIFQPCKSHVWCGHLVSDKVTFSKSWLGTLSEQGRRHRRVGRIRGDMALKSESVYVFFKKPLGDLRVFPAYPCQHEEGCEAIARQGVEYGKPLFCKKHQVVGMVDVISPRCLHPDCTKRPYFGEAGAQPLYCKAHMTGNMLNEVTKLCEYPDCKKQPVFAFPGGKRPSYCLTHKSEGMINIINKRCIQEDCNTVAHFNYP